MEEKRNAICAFIVAGVLILISLLYYEANVYYIYLVVYIWFGVAYGLLLQYGRFCFASAFRDLFAIGVPRMIVGIIIAMTVFSLVTALLTANKMGTFHPGPLGIHEVIGGFIFGIGMVLAGGCASGTLYKTGEGNGTSLLALLGIVFSQAILVNTSLFDKFLKGYAFKLPTITLAKTKVISEMFPGSAKYFVGNFLINTVIPSILLILVVYLFWFRKGFMKRRMKKKKTGGKTLGGEFAGLWGLMMASKRTSIAGVLIGIVSGLHVWTMKGMQVKFGASNFGYLLTRMGHVADVSSRGTVFDPGYWYITTQEAQVGAWVFEKLGFNMRHNVFFGVMNGVPELWRNPALWMSIGIIGGSMMMALLNKEFAIKLPKGELIVWGLLGGIGMGIGARVALGCNIGAFFIRIAGGDPGGWLFGIGMVLGSYVSVKFFNWWTARKMATEMEAF
ncbi:putative inner membrane protein [bacterium BMS3Abin08]|nr:putative inner membrane protein [bacterium BMS3Abin08]